MDDVATSSANSDDAWLFQRWISRFLWFLSDRSDTDVWKAMAGHNMYPRASGRGQPKDTLFVRMCVQNSPCLDASIPQHWRFFKSFLLWGPFTSSTSAASSTMTISGLSSCTCVEASAQLLSAQLFGCFRLEFHRENGANQHSFRSP